MKCDVSQFNVGDYFHNGFVKYIIVKIRKDGSYIETHKISDKYGQWKGIHLLDMERITTMYKAGFRLYKKEFLENDLFIME